MKHSFLLLTTIVLLFSCSQNQTTKIDNKSLLSTDLIDNPRSATGTDSATLALLATMDFKDTVLLFNNIKEGEVVTHDFEFKNNGKRPLVISSAKGSCGCTVADFPTEPMIPGQSGVIKIRFNSAGKSGHQEKTVTILDNSNKGVHMLYLKGDIKPTE
jgi:hypothetical protein